MFLLVILIIVVLATAGFIQYDQIYNYWARKGVPHESPLPIFGNMYGIGSRLHFRDVNRRLYKQYKGSATFVGLYIFLKRAVLLIDLELIKSVLIKDFNSFHDRGLFSNVRDDPLTGHLLTLEGDEWRSMRNKLTPVFSSGKMKHMFSVVVEVGERLADTLADGDVTDLEVKELCARYTTDVIGTCAFGLECNSLANPEAEFRVKGRMILDKPRHNPLIQIFVLTNPKLARKLRFKLLPDELSKFFMEAVRTTVNERLKHNIKRNDFLDQLIELKAENEERARKNNGIDLSHGLTIEQMAAQAFVFFIAGFETSSSTMAFCLYELALHPEVQQRLREEIERELRSAGGQLTYEAMRNMVYLEQVLLETLRKYPIIPQLIRETTHNYPVPETNYIIEKGITVLVPVHSLHYDEEYYPNPEHFDPERFTPEAIAERPQFTYLPFGDGQRNCIGLRFGKMQAKIGLISLLRKFHFSASDKTEVPLKLNNKTFPTSTVNGIHLKVQSI